VARYKDAARLLTAPTISGESIKVAKYEGTNQHVLGMTKFLDRHLRRYLAGAYVHGSLGTYDEVAYSDFDGLVILSGAAFESARTLEWVGRKLHEARAIMLNYDPLQHHGWFVLTEMDLLAYPFEYFPPVLFRHAKALLPDRGTMLMLSANVKEGNSARGFNDLADTVRNKALRGRGLRNLYDLKCFLSEMMLLPALYVQARDGAGVYKKDSFDLARKDFSHEQWMIMDQVSQIRLDWHYEISAWRRRLLMIRHTVMRKWILQMWSPEVPDHIEKHLAGDFYARAAHLAQLMCERLSGHPPTVARPPSDRPEIA
jgi:hypothetical protein